MSKVTRFDVRSGNHMARGLSHSSQMALVVAIWQVFQQMTPKGLRSEDRSDMGLVLALHHSNMAARTATQAHLAKRAAIRGDLCEHEYQCLELGRRSSTLAATITALVLTILGVHIAAIVNDRLSRLGRLIEHWISGFQVVYLDR